MLHRITRKCFRGFGEGPNIYQTRYKAKRKKTDGAGKGERSGEESVAYMGVAPGGASNSDLLASVRGSTCVRPEQKHDFQTETSYFKLVSFCVA